MKRPSTGDVRREPCDVEDEFNLDDHQDTIRQESGGREGEPIAVLGEDAP